MTTCKLEIPRFHSKKSFELYKQEILGWEKLTKLANKERGLYVALSLPDGDDTRIREKVWENFGIAKMETDTGLKDLIDFMELHLGIDELEDAWNKYEEFDDYRRTGESMSQFISGFDMRYQRVKNKGLTIPPAILAFKLFKSAMLSTEERMLIKTGLDFDKKDDMYEDAKKSLKKFKGESIGMGTSSSNGAFSDSIQVKTEPTFYTDSRSRGRGRFNRDTYGSGYRNRDSGGFGRGGTRDRGGARNDGYARGSGGFGRGGARNDGYIYVRMGIRRMQELHLGDAGQARKI